MKKGVNCKICKRPMTVDIDDDYSALGDPLKLIALACCNRCHDFRGARQSVENAIARICRLIQCASEKERPKLIPTQMEPLVTLTKRFNTLVANYHACQNVWDVEMVTMMTERPDRWFSVLSQTVKMIRSTPKHLTHP